MTRGKRPPELLLLNVVMSELLARRAKAAPKPLQQLLASVMRAIDARTPCRLTLKDGGRPLCAQQILFADGAIRYLALQQELHQYSLPPQPARVELPEAALVYDVRARKRIGKVKAWDVTLSRGQLLLFALMPYEVASVEATAPARAKRGEMVSVAASVRTSSGKPGHHVVRLDVFAPGAEEPHRQYSQNIVCDGGRGAATIPFALSDAAGQWRLEFRDAAAGIRTSRTLVLME